MNRVKTIWNIDYSEVQDIVDGVFIIKLPGKKAGRCKIYKNIRRDTITT